MCSLQGTTAFNRVCKMWLQNYLFFFFYYFLFLNRQGCCPSSYVSSGAMRKLDLRSSLGLNVSVLNWFYVFERFILIANKESLRCWTLKRRFKFLKLERIVKVLDLETISSDIWWKEVGLWIDFFFSIFVVFITFQSH